MDTPRISVLIAAYNVEEFLSECVESILRQSFQDFEIVIVNDASTDSSGDIADELAKKYDKVRVVHHEQNSGLSVTRNSGLSSATGEYICFVDGDDYLSDDCLQYLLDIVDKTKTQMAMSLNRFEIWNPEQVTADKIEIYSNKKLLEDIYYGHNIEAWNKIYKRETIEKYSLRFLNEIKYGEGMTFNILLLQHVKKIGIGRRRVWHYRYNFESATRSFSLERREGAFTAFDIQRDREIIKDKRIERARNWHIWRAYYSGFMAIIRAGKEYEVKFRPELHSYRKQIRLRFQDLWKSSLPISHKLKGMIIFIAPKLAAKEHIKRTDRYVEKYKQTYGKRA